MLKAAGFVMALIAQVALVSRMITRQGFKIEQSIVQNNKLEAKVDKLSDGLFPNGKPAFIYKEDCSARHKDICDVIQREIGLLKEEFVKRDDSRQSAHTKLWTQIDILRTDVIRLQSENKAGNAK